MVGVVRQHWFYLLLPLWLMAAWLVSRDSVTTSDPLVLEKVYLFDFGLFLPLLYFLFLRSRVTLRAALLRTMALAGAGLWLAATLMPSGEGEVLPWVSWLRYVALPLLIGIELVATVAIMRQVWSKEPDEQALIAQGVPPLVVKLLVLEARFWKGVWRWVTGR